MAERQATVIVNRSVAGCSVIILVTVEPIKPPAFRLTLPVVAKSPRIHMVFGGLAETPRVLLSA
jgi:hypothetical protein